jgi:hypothetical protein
MIGVSTTVRYSHASHKTENPFANTSSLESDGIWGGPVTSQTLTMDHGGLQWNGGVSLRF